jgi:lipopolysaccharide/colanic/teichoic acid biosynthesis glycosyltransferase
MYINAPNTDISPHPEDPLITRVGHLLRIGLDELPQLWNVLLGDMSIVGPRPIWLFDNDSKRHFNDEEDKMLSVLPGITGWAQVNGRKSLTQQEKISMSAWYVGNISFWLDLKICLLTLFSVFNKNNN